MPVPPGSRDHPVFFAKRLEKRLKKLITFIQVASGRLPSHQIRWKFLRRLGRKAGRPESPPEPPWLCRPRPAAASPIFGRLGVFSPGCGWASIQPRFANGLLESLNKCRSRRGNEAEATANVRLLTSAATVCLKPHGRASIKRTEKRGHWVSWFGVRSQRVSGSRARYGSAGDCKSIRCNRRVRGELECAWQRCGDRRGRV